MVDVSAGVADLTVPIDATPSSVLLDTLTDSIRDNSGLIVLGVATLFALAGLAILIRRDAGI